MGYGGSLELDNVERTPILVANGVTSVRDMGGRLEQIDDWRTKIAAGLLVGPGIMRVGPMLNGKPTTSSKWPSELQKRLEVQFVQ